MYSSSKRTPKPSSEFRSVLRGIAVDGFLAKGWRALRNTFGPEQEYGGFVP